MCCPLQVRYGKREGGGGAVQRFRPDTKSGERGGGERGCLAEKGAVPYMKGGVATPKTPPPGSASVRASGVVWLLSARGHNAIMTPPPYK